MTIISSSGEQGRFNCLAVVGDDSHIIVIIHIKAKSLIIMKNLPNIELNSLNCYVCSVAITNFKMLDANQDGKTFECECPICHRLYKIKAYFA